VIIGYAMPRMTGFELAGEILKVRHDLPIILSTGSNDSLTPERIAASGLCRVLLKPFFMADLGRLIREVLVFSVRNAS
jgi:two-component system, cell cycle sensor histidine kinase and response regulator CckA